MTASCRNRLATLLVAATLSSPVAGATKSSDVLTCTAAASTDTFEFDRRFLQEPEYARFGLILCRPRGEASADVILSSRGSLTTKFFTIATRRDGIKAGIEPAADPMVLAKTLGLPQESNWVDLLDELRKQGKLRPILREKIPADGELWIGYVATMVSDRLARTEADINYSADALETEKLMTVPLERPFRRWDKFVDTLPAFVTNLLAVIVGAGLSYFFFERQQRVLARLDELKLFRQRKLERSAELLVFFRDVYNADLRTETDEVQAVGRVRRALVEHRIYSMLPLDVMDALNQICDSNQRLSKTRGMTLDDLLRANFRELMVDP